jgi:hypothetical protein
MNKRIIISESEKKSILSQHKQTIKRESDLKKQSLSEREMSKLINSVLINEGSTNPCDTMYCEPGTTCINGKCVDSTTPSKIGGSGTCTSDSQCPRGQRCVGGSCSITTSLKESSPCKSESDCPPNMACYNGKCSVTTSNKQMKEGKACPDGQQQCGGGCCPKGSSCRLGMCQSGAKEPTAPIFFEQKEMKEGKACPDGQQQCGGGCCPKGSSCRLGMCQSGISQPTTPVFNESELDEIIYEIEFDEEINEQPKTIIKKPVPLKGRTCPEGWYRCGGGCCPSSGGGAGFTSGCKDGQCYYTYTTTSEPTKF